MVSNISQQGSLAEAGDDLSLIDLSLPFVPAAVLPGEDEHIEDFNIDDFLVFPSQDSSYGLQQSSAADMPGLTSLQTGIMADFIVTPHDPVLDFDSMNFDAVSNHIGRFIDNPERAAATSDLLNHGQNLLPAVSKHRVDLNLDMNLTEDIRQIQPASTEELPWALAAPSFEPNTISHNNHMDLSQTQHFQSSEYVSGYLACLEDLTNASTLSQQVQTPSISHFPNASNYYSETSRILNTGSQFKDFVSPTGYQTTEFSGINLNSVNEAPQCTDNSLMASLVRATSGQPEPNSTKDPFRFVYMSASGGAKGRLSSDIVTLRRQRSKKSSLAVRRKVIRKKGAACGICGEQKAKCDAIAPSQPCKGCLKMALFNQALAFRLCFGYKTKAWHTRAEISEFCGGPRYSEQYIWGLVPAIKKRKIKLGGFPLRSDDELRINRNYLELEVDELNTPSAAEVAGLLNVAVSSKSYSCLESLLRTEVLIPGAFNGQYLIGQYGGVEIVDSAVIYRISDDSLQCLLKQLVKWNWGDLVFRCQYPPESHQGYLDGLLLAYFQRQSSFNTLVISTLIATAVARNLGDLLPVQVIEGKALDEAPMFVRLSMAARLQIFGIALLFFEKTEKIVLEEIDKLVYRNNSARAWQLDPLCSDPLIIGLCVRRMALEYREIMLRYKHLGPEFIHRYENAQKMYDTMTRHYRHVFRGTLSPFDKDWKMEDHAAALGNDEELIKELEEFKLAEEYHCKNQLDPEEDGVYLNLFVKKQNRKGDSFAKSIGLI